MTSTQYQKVYRALLDRMSKAPLEMTIEELREGFEKMMVAFPISSDITMETEEIGKLKATWIKAPQATKERVILFFHGGGYTAGSTASHQDFLGRLSRASGYYILGVDYRLAPENPFPAALEDALKSYHFLLEEGYTSDQIIIAGTSAGGGLGFALLYALQEKGEKMPLAVLGLCPWLDLTLSTDSITRNEGRDIIAKRRLQEAVDMYLHSTPGVSNTLAKKPLISPLLGDPTGFPPTYIVIGSCELLLDENVHFAQKLIDCHVSVTFDTCEDMFHTWFLYAAKIPEGQQAIERMAQFLKKI